jgi:NAD(P)-dependent dehydrogenase (short-subunit alcohol dehydrogenase family)
MRLHNEIAIVTGATSGLGEAIARRFGAEGAAVAVVGRNHERGASVVDAIVASGGTAAFLAADVTVEADVARLVAAVVTRFGKPGILVNNAGLTIPGAVVDLSLEQWETIFRINVTSTYLVSHYVIPHMVEQRNGSVINISSEAGLKGFKARAGYCAAKSALIGLTKAMAIDHSGSGVRVNCICPGTIETPLVKRLLAAHSDPEALMAEFLQRRLTPFLGAPEDIAEAALYFAERKNRYATGAILSVDGGALAK